MPRGQCSFRQGDVTRAIRAAGAAGREVRRIEIDRDGKIVLVLVEQPKVEPESDGAEIVL
jgi:hypothetical protein